MIVSGRVRLSFRPLLDDLPIVGAVQVVATASAGLQGYTRKAVPWNRYRTATNPRSGKYSL